MLKGYKTYVLAVVTSVTAIAGYLVGDMDLVSAIQLVVTAGMGAFIRDGINTAVKQAAK